MCDFFDAFKNAPDDVQYSEHGVPQAKKRSPRKARVARERPRGADGLFLSANGHKRSTGRYVGVNNFMHDPYDMQKAAAAAYTRLNALHDHKLQLDVKKIELGQQQALREAKDRTEKERADTERRAREIFRARELRMIEQREQVVKQQIDCEKQLANQQIRSTEAWVKTLTPGPVS